MALPDDYATTCALATDDLMIFSVAPPHHLEPSKLQRRAFDDVIIKYGLIPATEKHVHNQPSATCIGIDIDNGYYLAPHAPKASMLHLAVARLVSANVQLSDLEVAVLLGQCIWFGIMNRPSLAAFDLIYKTTTRGGGERMPLSLDVVRNLAHFTCLLPLLGADLRRVWQSCILATDASVDYGFGVSIADVPTDVTKRLAKVAAHNGHYVRLSRDEGHPDDETELVRRGVGHNIWAF